MRTLPEEESWLTMDLKTGEHPDDDSLEKYLLGSLDEHEVKRIEEHLLMCQVCVKKASKLGDYIQAMRKALETGPTNGKTDR
jgi:hypothetical protein